MTRQLRFLFQEPGLLEAVALDPLLPKPQDGLDTPGYRSLWVADLLVDYAFSWAYTHFVLADQPLLRNARKKEAQSPSLTNQVLQYAAAMT